ncbi:uncharacterized protein LOC134194655 [Corticium candelabrum]|uniref:uncharacterized protein LOC134194655 n=1 Tax=Corticium candelabrum TaxID=121492 RepID=UPI002E26B9AC|nr:uncharacterized protein LOC134194655 [Corticium candelabrum]
MSDDWEKYVVPHLVELVKILQPSCFLDHLRADGLLSREECATLTKSYQTEESRSRALLEDFLPRKGPDALTRFCSILRKVGQEHAAELIQGKRSVEQAASSHGSVKRKRSLSNNAKRFRDASKVVKSTFCFRQEDEDILKDREDTLRAMCRTFFGVEEGEVEFIYQNESSQCYSDTSSKLATLILHSVQPDLVQSYRDRMIECVVAFLEDGGRKKVNREQIELLSVMPGSSVIVFRFSFEIYFQFLCALGSPKYTMLGALLRKLFSNLESAEFIIGALPPIDLFIGDRQKVSRQESSESVTHVSSVLSRFSSEKATILHQLQNCLQSAINVLISDRVVSEEDVADVISILQELDDPEIATEALYDVVLEKAESDPSIVVAFRESIGKVTPTICGSSPRLTWQQLKRKREAVVQTLDTSAVDACVEKGVITRQQYQGLTKLKQMGKPSHVVADRFFHVLEKLSEDDQGSQLAEFEKILSDKQPNLLKTLLEADQNHHTNDSIETIGIGSDLGSQTAASYISDKSAAISTANTRDEASSSNEPIPSDCSRQSHFSNAVENVTHLGRRLESDSERQLRMKQQFYEMMIGDSRPNSTNDDSLFTVELEKLSSEKVVDIYRKCGGKGFAVHLKSYLVDLLKRRENFQSVVDVFVSVLARQTRADETAALPRLLLEITLKDIFIALLEVMPDAVHSRLVSLYSSLYCAVPFAYVLQLSVDDTRTVTNFQSLEDVLAVPSHPLVVSCGTANAVRKGKSTLTGKLVGQLETTSLGFDSFDVCSDEGDGGLCHSPSIDLLLEVKSNVRYGLNFADVHGFTYEKSFCHALSTLCSVAALVLVHVTANDFGPGGSLGDSLRSFLLDSCNLHCSNAEIAIFVRDVPSSAEMSHTIPQSSSINQSLGEIFPNRIAQVVFVEDLAKCRTQGQRQMTVIRIKDEMAPIFDKLKQRLPCSEVIQRSLVGN